ncbi:TIGR03943 family putative permease subunit [Actinomyces bouchesdurhonensis]|uniref:TIGR03943 family putative permease subunit n=1 Tax=Actinomyces bouchesdurhonensis TaxID=1852361 RepID=UPI0028EBCA1B|nr:TIGR03943 family protein [Actinomyces bouchesdurhonensis]
MKLVDRIAPTLEALALAGLGAALVWMALSGRYGSFVPPSARLGIALSGVALLACSLALSSRLGAGEGGHVHGSASSRRGLTRCVVAVLAALMLVLPFHVSPSELASTTLSARAADAGDEAGAGTGEQAEESPSEESPSKEPASTGAGAQSAGQSGVLRGSGAQASSGGTLELTTENFAAQIEELSSQGKVHDGQRVELTGFVMSEASARGQASIPRLTSEESFAVARMAIWCCAADAYAVGFVVRWDGAVPAADSWVHVAGTLRLRGNKALVIEADSVEATSAPDPEFVVQQR